MRTFLVTGGAGFIGSHIAAALVQRGDRVRVLDNLSTGSLANLKEIGGQPEFFEADLLDTDILREALQGVDCVFHQAALASVPRSIKTPLDTHAACVTGTINLLNESRKAEVRRVVYAASSSAYGDQVNSTKRETDLPAPRSPYAAAKLAAEYYAQAFFHTYGLETVAIRYFNVFGPRQDPDSPYSAVIPRFITAMLNGKSPVVYGDGKQTRDFTYVANVVDGNLLAADADHVTGRVFNVSNGRTTSLLKLIELLNEYLGTEIEPEFELSRPGDVRESMGDIAMARRYLAYEPRIEFEDGLRTSIDYYRSIVAV